MVIHPIFNKQHNTVLLKEAVNALEIRGARTNGIYVDGTIGGGGHSLNILNHLSKDGILIAFDKDPTAVAEMQTVKDSRFIVKHNSFSNLDLELTKCGISKIDGILLDLGVSSLQINNAARGFSFQLDGPLDMRMDTTCGISAAKWLSMANEKIIAKIIQQYGEERFAFQIAKAVVTHRATQPILTTRQLALLIAQVVKTREKHKNPATRTFQAIRIFINQELQELEIGLHKSFNMLNQHGKLVVISFHSLEDRIVKKFMASKAHPLQPDRCLPIYSINLPRPEMKLLPFIKPSKIEVINNLSSRSAIMRVAERL